MRPSLGEILAELQIDSRRWELLELRLDRKFTLEVTGDHLGGISRERVRQLESKMARRLGKYLSSIESLLNLLETSPTLHRIPHRKRDSKENESSDRQTLVAQIQMIFEANGYDAASEDVNRLITLIRASVFFKQRGRFRKLAVKNWPRITYLACRLPPPIMQHHRVARAIGRESVDGRRLSYRALAYQVLAEAKQPLHWSVIVERAYQIGHRASFSSAALYNALQRHRDQFVRVGPGTYALVESGVKAIDTFPDIIAAVLEQEGRALPAETIYTRVIAIRRAKRQSITMSLDMHPRFYRSIESTYGLRAWLAPRDMQTLRTPEWLVEDSASFARVQRAIEKGYKVEDLIEPDNLPDYV